MGGEIGILWVALNISVAFGFSKYSGVFFAGKTTLLVVGSIDCFLSKQGNLISSDLSRSQDTLVSHGEAIGYLYR